MTVPDEVYRLVEQFDQNRAELKSHDYNEALLRAQYLNPLIHALGWDIYNVRGVPLADMEVVHEDAIRVGGAHKAPDYGFCIGRKHKFSYRAGGSSCCAPAIFPMYIGNLPRPALRRALGKLLVSPERRLKGRQALGVAIDIVNVGN